MSHGAGPDGNSLPGGVLLGITNALASRSFVPLYLTNGNGLNEINRPNLPPDVLAADFNRTWTNYSTTLSIGSAVLVVFPTNQTALTGQSVTFSALAWHTAGYQWQHNGTNLLANAHFLGVTNVTHTIVGAQADDPGDYTVIAQNPNHAASDTVSLAVVPPPPLVLALQPVTGAWQLTVAHADGSPLDPSEITGRQIHSTTNLAQPCANWLPETNPGTLDFDFVCFIPPEEACRSALNAPA